MCHAISQLSQTMPSIYTSVAEAKRKPNQQIPNPGTNVHQVSEQQKLLLMLPTDHQHEESSVRDRDQQTLTSLSPYTGTKNHLQGY